MASSLLFEAFYINWIQLRRDFPVIAVLATAVVEQAAGGDDSWGAPIYKEFSLPAVPYEYKFRMEPITGR